MSNERVVVIFVNQPDLARRLSKLLGEAEFRTVVCSHADELHRVLNSECVDALVLEDELPGFFRGTELIARMQQDLLRPPTLLLADATRELKERSAVLRIDSILPPDEDPQRLCTAVKGLVSAATHGGPPLPLAARQLVTRTEGIRPIPQLMVRLAGYLNDDDAQVADVARDISADPRVTADLLSMTNSSALGSRKRITRVVDAVAHIGIRRTVALAFSSAVRSSQASSLRPLPSELREWFQFRSVLVANVASAFAGRRSPALAESAYILGLMQELGILVMLTELRGVYAKMLKRVRTVGQLHLPLLEVREFGFHHGQVSAALLQKWGLASHMIRLVAQHHALRDDEPLPDVERALLSAIRVADAFADFRDIPCPQRHERLTKALAALGPMDAEGCRDGFAQAITKTIESAEIFSVPVPPEFRLEEVLQSLRDPGVGRNGAAADAEEPVDPPTVLIVDDDRSVVAVLEEYLHALGLETRSACDVESALAAADGATAILCDIHLKYRDGIELVRLLRARGLEMPVLMISGDRSRQTVINAIEAGASDYIVKPFTRRMICEKLTRWGVLHSPAASATACAAESAESAV